MRKIARQPTVSTSQPPITGPSAPVIAPAAAQVPIARPRSSPENPAPRMARLDGISSAAPTPWTARPASNSPRLGASAQASEARLNSISPAANTCFRP